MGRWLPVWALLVTTSAVSLMAAQQPIKRLDGSTITPAEIDATVTRLMQAAEVPGVGIAIFNDNKIAYLKTYGVRDAGKNLPLTPDSVMTAASLTKSAFATVVMQLVAEGKLDWDTTPVNTYLPEFETIDPVLTSQLTLQDLLSHRTVRCSQCCSKQYVCISNVSY